MVASTYALDAIGALHTLVKRAVQDTQGYGRTPVDVGWPATLQSTHVWVGTRLVDWRQEWVVSGLGGKDEHLTIPVYVYALRRGSTFEVVRKPLDDLAKAITAELATDYNLGGSVMLAQVERAELEEGPRPEEGSREGGVTLYVRIHEYVTS
jgi:hypothetical protein